MGFCKLMMSAFIWLFCTLYVYINPFINPEVPGWVLSVGIAVMLAGWISYSDK